MTKQTGNGNVFDIKKAWESPGNRVLGNWFKKSLTEKVILKPVEVTARSNRISVKD